MAVPTPRQMSTAQRTIAQTSAAVLRTKESTSALSLDSRKPKSSHVLVDSSQTVRARTRTQHSGTHTRRKRVGDGNGAVCGGGDGDADC
eukprot:6204555-Pleurochrysis_carterae.AAC.3